MAVKLRSREGRRVHPYETSTSHSSESEFLSDQLPVRADLSFNSAHLTSDTDKSFVVRSSEYFDFPIASESTLPEPDSKNLIKRHGTSREFRFGASDSMAIKGFVYPDPVILVEGKGHFKQSQAVSINMALVFIFGLSVAALGASLIIVSASFLNRSESLQSQSSLEIQVVLLALVNDSSTDLGLATNDAVNHLVFVVLDQTYRRALELVDNYTRWCEFSVLEMVDMWHGGLLDPRNLDLSRTQLWKVLLRFGSVTRVGFADSARGNYVGIQRLPGGLYDLEMRNESGTKFVLTLNHTCCDREGERFAT